MLKSAKFPPYSRTEPAVISGHQGEAFFGQATNANGENLAYNVTWVKLDSSHAAALARLWVVNATPQEIAALDALVGKVRVVGAK